MKHYCTYFNDDHWIHGGFSAEKFSWMRLIIHQCDNSEAARNQRVAANKNFIDCVGESESLKYFETTI